MGEWEVEGACPRCGQQLARRSRRAHLEGGCPGEAPQRQHYVARREDAELLAASGWGVGHGGGRACVRAGVSPQGLSPARSRPTTSPQLTLSRASTHSTPTTPLPTSPSTSQGLHEAELQDSRKRGLARAAACSLESLIDLTPDAAKCVCFVCGCGWCGCGFCVALPCTIRTPDPALGPRPGLSPNHPPPPPPLWPTQVCGAGEQGQPLQRHAGRWGMGWVCRGGGCAGVAGVHTAVSAHARCPTAPPPPMRPPTQTSAPVSAWTGGSGGTTASTSCWCVGGRAGQGAAHAPLPLDTHASPLGHTHASTPTHSPPPSCRPLPGCLSGRC